MSEDNKKSDFRYKTKSYASKKRYQSHESQNINSSIDRDCCYSNSGSHNSLHNKSMDQINRNKQSRNEDRLPHNRRYETYGRHDSRYEFRPRNKHSETRETRETRETHETHANVRQYYNNCENGRRRENDMNCDKRHSDIDRNVNKSNSKAIDCDKSVETTNCRTDSDCSAKVSISTAIDKQCNHSHNIQLQLDEITALKSIFDEKVLIIDESQLKGRFLAEPILSKSPYLIVYNNRNDYSYRSNDNIKRKGDFLVEHLPPLELYFELPEDYPLKSQPKFLISCKWLKLSDLESICDKLERLWSQSKMEVLYTWFSFLQNEVLIWLGYSDRLDITHIIGQKPKWITKADNNSEPNDPKSSKSDSITTVSKLALSRSRPKSYRNNSSQIIQFKPQLSRGNGTFDQRSVCDLIGADLITHLKAYNQFKIKEIFDKSYITCNICFSQRLGEDCVQFPCLHMNCKKCIKDYFTTLIAEGSVNLLKCPELKCDTSAPPNLVRELISEELFKKYDELLLASVIGSMSDVYYCPRKACGSLVIAESESSLAHCSSCGFAFCKNCKYSYHGFDPCQIFRNAKQRQLILDKYSEATGNEKLQLEKLYGKKQLIAALEEAATEKWIEEMSKRCPHCKAAIEKSDGCNKMSCWRCNTYFCWLCLQRLPLTLPYSHYNNPESKCYNQLFHGVNFDDIDIFEDIVD